MVSEAKGHRFESCRARHLIDNAGMLVLHRPPPARDRAAATGSRSATRLVRSPNTFAFVVLAGVALLGNGLKSIVSSSVLVSEGQFAALLGIAIEQVAVLLELIIAGMVVALAACPLLLQRMSAWALAIGACLVAAAAFATFALVDLSGQPPVIRAIAAFGCFALGAGALALLAPTAQALVTLAPMPAMRTTLTSLWTGAAPAGFLVAPQMVKVLLPALGIGFYFLGFAALPLVLLALLGVLGFALPAVRNAGITVTVLPTHLLLAFVAAVVAFEIWTTSGSVSGYATPGTLAGLALFAATVFWLARAVKGYVFPPSLTGPSGVFLLALFVLEMPTTGFFDTAWLVQHQFPESFIADRATLSAAAQIGGTIVASVLVHRRPAASAALLLGFGGITIAGLAALAAYPWIAHPLYFLWTPAIGGFGVAGLTVLVCLAVLRDAATHPLLAALPSIAIMLGTEFGLELLQLVFAVARAAGIGDDGAYGAIFGMQVVFALVALRLLCFAIGRGGAGGRPP